MVLLLRELVHQIQHQFFEDDTQTARADIAFDGIQRDGFQGVIRKFQLHIFVLEQPLVLFDKRVLRPRENLDQRLLIQVVQSCDDRDAADKLRYHSELDQVFRFQQFK